ncbi:unnamed protein product [Acanthoscelides obtectus]|uniref:Glycoprotein n=1 Tax=Acanthoscelides obtectus TaxID=200917 RepID=A0A9P0LRH8_ACAOB|nr:unnamed protein product [Acanthoscelides obtectus]CAK1657179.1 hypothetical protein AOBTE_LOCUS20182 [Acanthoscelides obtectus]
MFGLLVILAASMQLLEADIIAYDCKDDSVELTKVSLLNVKPCLDPRKAEETKPWDIQLVQKRQYVGVHVYTCLITVQQTIQHCGMHSHSSTVAGGLGKYVLDLSDSECRKAQRFQHLDLRAIGAGMVSQLTKNGTTEISTTLQGQLDTEGRCEGVTFTVGEVVYKNVVVSGAITIKLSDYDTVANVELNTIHLRSGTICPFNDGACFDDLSGIALWESHYEDQCTNKGVDVLYEGNATLLTLRKDPQIQYVIVETDDTVFALKLTKPEDLCHQHAWQTEQNRLLVIFRDSIGFYFRKSTKIAQNTDMMAHVLSKLLYLEIAVKRYMADIVYDAIVKRCQLREKILQNRITMALQAPDLIGNLIKETTGYVGRVMGEVLYIAKCKPIVVEIRKSQKCYQELPVTYNNETWYRMPISHILVQHGKEVDCQPLLPANFQLEGTWIEISPALKRTSSVMELDANEEKDTITLTKISPISSHGLYTKEEMDTFQQALLFPNEREAVANEMARRLAGRKNTTNRYYMPGLFTREEFKNIAITAAEHVWGFLSRMGNIFSVCAFLYTMLCIASYVASVIANYFTLRNAARNHPRRRRYLWASLWQALAHRYLYHLHTQREGQFELQEINHQSNAETTTEVDVAIQVESVPTAPGYPQLRPCKDSTCLDPHAVAYQ